MEKLIKTLEEIKEHQMQYVELARTTQVYKLADKAIKQALNIQNVSTTVNCEKWQHDLKRELKLNDNCELCGEKL